MDDEKKEYRWEEGYEKTWEAIREDEEGFLDRNFEELIKRQKRKKMLEKHAVIRLGVMRHLYVVLDLSESMLDLDLKPNRQICAVKLLERFVDDFFDQNPISQLGLLVTQNKKSEKVCELGGNPRTFLDTLKGALDKPCSGEPSLVNSLELAATTLKNMPSHTSREILIILGGLTTCDPVNIYSVLKMLIDNNIRCSIIGLAAELYVCKEIAQKTGGTYGVILDDSHFKDLLTEHVTPPPSSMVAASSLIRMGFPHRCESNGSEGKPSLCMCHLDSKDVAVSAKGYYCPQCQGKYCDLPVECKSCGLTLVSAPHLARSYHYFFRLPGFTEVPREATKDSDSQRFCQGCQKEASDQTLYKCPKCSWQYCFDCDMFIHDTLHICPGCQA
ncbi:General transcription factor IIH subunit 2 [Chamberlinius hualienensis]